MYLSLHFQLEKKVTFNFDRGWGHLGP